ncbi:hypothetical protein LTR22_001258 [Elasticomyces elasticus]|nr:hypothetical protein LTR22_001258 [Elasticomyces elasticus]KAK4932194.1 hypothetical protein LTR49_001491 [Elasticomyces elasticus]KAK5763426.1 hypothetical protein LTS12_006397 [Elasticomyces elasticus]
MAVTRTTDKHDDYWKLEQQDWSIQGMRSKLESYRYRVGSLRDKERLAECVRRAQSGLTSYYNLTNDQLRELIVARKIDTSYYKNTPFASNKERLLATLELEDRKPKFYRFLDLPAELRNSIYAYYFSEFYMDLYAPSQPPISRACSQLRAEALPMFYATCAFELRLQHRLNTNRLDRPIRQRLTIGDRMLLFLHSTEPEHLAAIRDLFISVDHRTCSCPVRPDFAPVCRLDFTDPHYYSVKPYWAMDVTSQWANARPPGLAKKKHMAAAVEDIADTIASRGELIKANIFDLREAVELGTA